MPNGQKKGSIGYQTNFIGKIGFLGFDGESLKKIAKFWEEKEIRSKKLIAIGNAKQKAAAREAKVKQYGESFVCEEEDEVKLYGKKWKKFSTEPNCKGEFDEE